MKKSKTILDIQRLYSEGQKITMLTAYDYPMARLLDRSGIDIILVGDSLGTVVAGHDTTLPVTLDEMIYHTRSVARGTSNAVLVADLPFLSYQVDIPEARRSAGRLVKEGCAQAVKLEGGVHVQETIRAIVDMDVPVMGHVGLTPQSVHRMGGFRVQGRQEEQAEKILADARAVEEAGAFSIVLEGVPMDLARQITAELHIPTIGIGAGVHCDGQVLVTHDMIGLCDKFAPKFVKKYVDLDEILGRAFSAYIEDVRNGSFPDDDHSFK
ncbi:MAG: 3-methyl-2-oxobutanoate hydroxymethyltransferase [Deltaproteobacteria bacterium]|nr:3-methyl-2-oxobutanoate hydroxymethyltransferase [Deltaproteobacteria bacterium]